ncbi:ScbA/BarX family gamma-butyrolactone biosynthesis protein [Streptomyces sp. NPDC057638]|uniref:ScbA/BarX family gamma-butyrolactone biosynthesis protein n=1 Tax=Streptomyces sp. NPDC057638 TaxID=3346190 RepID=UPI00369AE09C
MDQVHRTRPEDAFLTGWTHEGDDQFSIRAVWPHDHPFYGSVATDQGRSHDPLLVAETMRQAGMLVCHAAYGVPIGYQFLLAGLEYTCVPEHLAAGDSPQEIDVEVNCANLTWRGGVPASADITWDVKRGGCLIASGSSASRYTSPGVYRRMRGESARPGVSIPRTAPLEPERVGRTRVEDVVLSATAMEYVWQLRVDTSHPTLFQRPNDHVPGMLLLESARQAACALTAVPFVPTSGRTRYYRYVEFDRPCWIQAAVLPSRIPHTTTVQINGQQDGHLAFAVTFTGPALSA